MYLRNIIYFFLTCVLATSLSGQSLLDEIVSLEMINHNIEDNLAEITDKYGISFSYSSGQFTSDRHTYQEPLKGRLEDVLRQIFYRYDLKLKEIDKRKIAINAQLKTIRVFGYVKDFHSEEVLAGSIIAKLSSGDVYLSSNEGYYNLSISAEEPKLYIRHLGYIPDTVSVEHQGQDVRMDIFLNFDNDLSPIIVQEDLKDNLLLDPGSDIINFNSIYGNKGITGENDIIQNLRMRPGVVSGGEGLLGLNINGGANDENLYLLDGMPVYEVSHLAGISSIFQEESINTVNMTTMGIPARYSGRMSSVIDVNLKEGNADKPQRSVSLSLLALKFGLEGPLSKNKKTTFNLAGRTSLFNYYSKPFVTTFTNFEDIRLNYDDLIAKITHRINRTNKISITGYIGADQIKFFNFDTLSTPNSFYQNVDENQLKWGNQVLSVRYNTILNSQVTGEVQFGYNKYRIASRGYYEVINEEVDLNYQRTVDVRTYSSIQDYQATASLNYYVNDYIKIRGGLSRIAHLFRPTVRQSLVKSSEINDEFVESISAINTSEIGIYGELNFQFSKYLFLYPGINYTNYNTENKSYPEWQPRLKLLLLPSDRTLITLSYNRLVQNVHLLSNTGIGIASDLWVPSLREIAPSTNDQFDLFFKQQITNGYTFEASWYNKSYTNLIEYSEPIDLHANVIIQNQNQIFYSKDSDWRNSIAFGNGYSRGFTLSLRKEIGKIKGWVNYHYNKNRRTFSQLNDGQAFPSKHEKPHDINIALSYEPSPKWVFGINWVYVSGGTFSLPDEKFESPLDIEVIGVNKRNNYRLPSFNQMTFTAERKTKFYDLNSTVSFGIYNVYNRLNPFYIYATNTPGQITPSLRKVSIFPVFPFINIKCSW